MGPRRAAIRPPVPRGATAIATIRAEAIVSPYKFRTAQAHYEALLAETRARGGPRVQTKTTVPDEWNGGLSPAAFQPGQRLLAQDATRAGADDPGRC